MKIAVYEARADERRDLEAVARELGLELAVTEKILDRESLCLAEGCGGITTLGQSRLDRDMLERVREAGITLLSTRSIGYNHIDLEAARELGIKVCNASYAPNGVADYTVMLILMLLRHYKPAMWRGHVNDYSLAGLQGQELRDLTVGVLGTGRIGRAVLENLRGFGCRLLAYDTCPGALEGVEYTDLETLYVSCDVISLHTPLLESTYHMIDGRALGGMKDGVILINCARGELMDMNDMIRGVEEEKIGGLGLDVFEKEEGIYHRDRRSDIIKNREMAYLRQFPNVIMTQHMAFYTDRAVSSMVRGGLEGIKRMSEGADWPQRLA